MFLKHCLAQELFSKHWEDVSKVLRWQFRLPDSNQASWGLRGEVRKLILSSEKSKPFIPQIPNLCSISACSVYFFMSCSYSTSFCSWENSKIYDDDDLIVKTWNSHKRHVNKSTLTDTLQSEICFQQVLWEVNEPGKGQCSGILPVKRWHNSPRKPGQFTQEQICKGF